MWMATKAEKDDLEQDLKDQLDGMDQVYQNIALDIQLCDLILCKPMRHPPKESPLSSLSSLSARWVPAEYQDAIEKLAVWNESIGEWQVPLLRR